MLIKFLCPNCQAELEVSADVMGQNAECLNCNQIITVPYQNPGPGTTIGGFYIKSLIGIGGTGTVYLAKQLSMERDVALKILSKEITENPEDLELFMNEIRVTANLEHPNIVSAYESGEDSGYYYMALTYVNGPPLDKMIQKSEKGYLPEKTALKITKKIASALAYAWNEHGIIHRDIKPENILIDTYGEPKLTDLGLSNSYNKMTDDIRDVIMGTPNYMSPEQMENISNADLRSDIYSLGATLYQMLTGKIPFDNSNMVKTLNFTADDFISDPRKYNRNVTLQCIKLLEKMMARHPADRYQNWEDVIAEITRILNGRTVLAKKLPAGKSVIRPITINRNHKKPITPTVQKTSPSYTGIITAAIISITVIFIVLKILAFQKEKQERIRRNTLIQKQEELQAEKEQILLDKYNNIVQYVNDNIDKNYPGCVAMLKKNLEPDAPLAGTEYENKLRLTLSDLVMEHEKRINQKWNIISKYAQKLIESGKQQQAVRFLRNYSGLYAYELKDKRMQLANELENK